MTFSTLLALAAFHAQQVPHSATQPPGTATSPPVAAPEPSDEAISIAQELFAGEDVRQQFFAGALMGIDAGISAGQRVMERNGLEMDETLRERLRAVLGEATINIVDAELPQFRREAAMLYARRFTLEELRELRELMHRPVVRRMQAMLPQLMLELAQMSERMFEPYQEELDARGMEVVEQWLSEQSPPTPSSS